MKMKDGSNTLAEVAAKHGHWELVQLLIQKQGSAMSKREMTKLMDRVAQSDNFNLSLKLVKLLRINGCPWYATTRDLVSEKFGYADDHGNLVCHV